MPETPAIELTRRELVAFCVAPLSLFFPVSVVAGGFLVENSPVFATIVLYSVFAAIAKAYALAMLVFLPLYVALKRRGWTSIIRVAAAYLGVMAVFQVLYSLVEGSFGPAVAESVFGIIGGSPYGLFSDIGAFVCLVVFWGIVYEFRLGPAGGEKAAEPVAGESSGNDAGVPGKWRWPGTRRGQTALRAILRTYMVLLALSAAAHALALLSTAGAQATDGANEREARLKLADVIMHNFTVIGSSPSGSRFAPVCGLTQAITNNELAIKQYWYLERFARRKDSHQAQLPEEGSLSPLQAGGSGAFVSARSMMERYGYLGYSALDRKLIVLGYLGGSLYGSVSSIVSSLAYLPLIIFIFLMYVLGTLLFEY